jgi:hypothetical protein
MYPLLMGYSGFNGRCPRACQGSFSGTLLLNGYNRCMRNLIVLAISREIIHAHLVLRRL